MSTVGLEIFVVMIFFAIFVVGSIHEFISHYPNPRNIHDCSTILPCCFLRPSSKKKRGGGGGGVIARTFAKPHPPGLPPRVHVY